MLRAVIGRVVTMSIAAIGTGVLVAGIGTAANAHVTNGTHTMAITCGSNQVKVTFANNTEICQSVGAAIYLAVTGQAVSQVCTGSQVQATIMGVGLGGPFGFQVVGESECVQFPTSGQVETTVSVAFPALPR